MNRLVIRLVCITLACVCLAAPARADSRVYDVVIQAGRVMDPASGYDAIANVGLTGDRISAISNAPLNGKRVIDATGLVVAPGFIDTHYHGTQPIHYRLALRDGVTSVMDLEFGALGSRVREWYAAREGTSLINYGTASSHELARASVLDGINAIDTAEAASARSAPNWSGMLPDAGQTRDILAVIAAGLDAGAIGVGSTLGYMPGATADELFQVQALAAGYGRQVGVHLRHTPGTETEEINGAQEVLANAVALGAPAIINHFNNPGWRRVHDLLRKLQSKGHNVWGEIYPYAAGSTTINAVFLDPSVWKDELGQRYEETIYDVQTNRFLSEEAFLALRAADPVRVILVFKMPEEEVTAWVGLPGTTIASDGLPSLAPQPLDTPLESLPNAHPRGAGSYAKALRIARENDIDLMRVLAQTSYNSARHLGAMGLKDMQERGRMQVGSVADIVVFDPERVTDHATYTQGNLPSTGFRAVFVSGRAVLENDAVDLRQVPGKPIRFSPANG